jgi:hypothetical protein
VVVVVCGALVLRRLAVRLQIAVRMHDLVVIVLMNVIPGAMREIVGTAVRAVVGNMPVIMRV